MKETDIIMLRVSHFGYLSVWNYNLPGGCQWQDRRKSFHLIYSLALLKSFEKHLKSSEI